MVEVHIEGLWHPPYAYLTRLFDVSFPLRVLSNKTGGQKLTTVVNKKRIKKLLTHHWQYTLFPITCFVSQNKCIFQLRK
jgi:hypothetical protein